MSVGQTRKLGKGAGDVVKQDEGTKGSLGDIGALDQSNAVDEASSFANDEDKNEEAIIHKAEQREESMERAAQKHLYQDEQYMKYLYDQPNEDVLNANKVHG